MFSGTTRDTVHTVISRAIIIAEWQAFKILNVQMEVCVSQNIVTLSKENQMKLDTMRKAESEMKNQPGIWCHQGPNFIIDFHQ